MQRQPHCNGEFLFSLELCFKVLAERKCGIYDALGIQGYFQSVAEAQRTINLHCNTVNASYYTEGGLFTSDNPEA